MVHGARFQGRESGALNRMNRAWNSGQPAHESLAMGRRSRLLNLGRSFRVQIVDYKRQFGMAHTRRTNDQPDAPGEWP
jgi:hypothetical protein